MLRVLLILLLVLNLLALAAGRGWLGVAPSRGEPERLSNQLHPERIVLHAELPAAMQALPGTIPPSDWSFSPPPDDAACLRFLSLDTSQADYLAELHAGEDATRREEEVLAADDTWWVHIPPAPSRDTAELRVRALREAGIVDLFILRAPDPREHAISLGLFANESRANRYRDDLHTQGITDVVVAPRMPPRHDIELIAPDDVLDSVRTRFAAQHPDTTIEPCTP